MCAGGVYTLLSRCTEKDPAVQERARGDAVHCSLLDGAPTTGMDAPAMLPDVTLNRWLQHGSWLLGCQTVSPCPSRHLHVLSRLLL